MHFFFKKAHITQKTSSRQNHFKASRQKEARPSYIRVLFKEPGYMLGNLSTKDPSDFKTRPSSSLYQIARGSGATPKWEYFFLQKGTHHAKISRSATRFRSRKHSDDACSCSTRHEGTRRGFQNSTMKCSGACRCGTHWIPHKEGRRSSLTMILPL